MDLQCLYSVHSNILFKSINQNIILTPKSIIHFQFHNDNKNKSKLLHMNGIPKTF